MEPIRIGGGAKQADTHGRLREVEMLLNVSRMVAAMETVDEVLRTLVEIVARETNSERGTLFLNDAATGELYSRVALGDHMREIRIVGPAEDDHIAGILATGATAAQLVEAFSWVEEKGDMGAEVQHPLAGVVARLYEILESEKPAWDSTAPRGDSTA